MGFVTNARLPYQAVFGPVPEYQSGTGHVFIASILLLCVASFHLTIRTPFRCAES